MKNGIVDAWIRIRASYWFIPSLMAIASIVAAVGFVHIDTVVGTKWVPDLRWFYANTPSGARALLSTMAGSMITVAGVTFSMTLLAVSHASAQIGPRLLVGFMSDRGNQMTLGTFIATFLYCLIVLRTVHGDAPGDADGAVTPFVPHVAILVALALAVLSVAVLIYFIHHVPQSINVCNVIARVGDELVEGIQVMYPERLGQEHLGQDRSHDQATRDRPADFEANSRVLAVAGQGGYLRLLDTDGLLAVAKTNDLLVEMQLRPGDFGIAGQPLLRVGPADRLNEDIISAIHDVFSWGTERTQQQDVMFPAEQLIEVLGKAMSPGINGQFTALLCLDQLARAFAEILGRDVPDAYRYDSDDQLRVIATPVTHEEFVAHNMRLVRQFIRGDWIACNHILKQFGRLLEMPQLEDRAALLKKEVELIRQDIQRSDMAENEKQLLL